MLQALLLATLAFDPQQEYFHYGRFTEHCLLLSVATEKDKTEAPYSTPLNKNNTMQLSVSKNATSRIYLGMGRTVIKKTPKAI